MEMKKIAYHKPKITSEKLFDTQMGGISLFARCYCDVASSSPNVGTQNAQQTCKAAKL